jgi:hypothetical protein
LQKGKKFLELVYANINSQRQRFPPPKAVVSQTPGNALRGAEEIPGEYSFEPNAVHKKRLYRDALLL